MHLPPLIRSFVTNDKNKNVKIKPNKKKAHDWLHFEILAKEEEEISETQKTHISDA